MIRLHKAVVVNVADRYKSRQVWSHQTSNYNLLFLLTFGMAKPTEFLCYLLRSARRARPSLQAAR